MKKKIQISEFELFTLKNCLLQIADNYCEFLEKGGVNFGSRQMRNKITNANLKFAKMIKWQFLDGERIKEIMQAVDFEFMKGGEPPESAAMRIFNDYFSLALADLSLQADNANASERNAFRRIYDNAPFLLANFAKKFENQNHFCLELL